MRIRINQVWSLSFAGLAADKPRDADFVKEKVLLIEYRILFHHIHFRSVSLI